jgi:hypothetical protein
MDVFTLGLRGSPAINDEAVADACRDTNLFTAPTQTMYIKIVRFS